tara:strand:+ start:845 stop:1051 length:207 start_codon:yes stop_codon:yes gene_type:complete
MAKLKSFLQELEDQEAIHYDEQQRQFVSAGGQCPATQRQQVRDWRKPTQQLQANHIDNEGGSILFCQH